VSGCSERPEVLSQCGREHGNHAIERWQCILALDAERAKEEEKIIREKNARECIAKKINGLENKVKEISNSIQEKSTFYEVENILKRKAEAVQKTYSSQDIKVPVLIATIRTDCDSEFYILINVSGYEPYVNHDYEISSLHFYAMNAPSGYNFPSYTFSKPFHEDRILARRFEVEKKQREIMAELEKNGSKKKSSYLDPCAPGIS
jgi:hypothetical protein